MGADLSFNRELLTVLYKKWARQPLSAGEQLLLDNWLKASPDNSAALSELESGKWVPSALKDWKREHAAAIWNKSRIAPALPVRRMVSHPQKWRWAAAASISLLLLSAAYLWVVKHQPGSAFSQANVHFKTDITPGKNGAILTLSNGKQVMLDTLHDGVIASQPGTTAALKNGQLTYNRTGSSSDGVTYNTMSTPKGRQFQLMLPDGTHVWLNAASSIRYPTMFTGHERRVEVTGEAYFEVTANSHMPFRVNVNNQAEIFVLGTHFNVNAYENEKTLNTTLLEGAVKITAKGENVLLKPGQQAQLSEKIKVTDDADLAKVIAWKNGLFNFNGATLEDVMNQLERWYDIQVVYEKGIPDIHFGGGMSKNISLTDLLTILEESKVHFRIDGRKLTVLP